MNVPDFIGPGGGCLVGWILFGLCGFVGRPLIPPGVVIPPKPDPDPPDTMGWLLRGLVAIIAAVVAGFYFHQAFSIDHADSAGILMTFLAAFAAGRIAAEVADRAIPARLSV